LLVDADGEWKDVFDGEQLNDEVRLRRARAGLKADPHQASFRIEAAELAFERGDAEAAAQELQRAGEADPEAGGAWALLRGLHAHAGRPEAAQACFARAAESSGDPARRAERFAEAARAARAAGDEPARAAHAVRARAADGSAVERWLATAREA